MIRKIITHLKFENHLTSWAVLFLLNLMSGKYILRMAEEGYRTQKNISLAFLRCIGVRVEFCASANEYPEIIFCLNKIFSVSCCRCQKWRHAHASRESFESIPSKILLVTFKKNTTSCKKRKWQPDPCYSYILTTVHSSRYCVRQKVGVYIARKAILLK